MAATETNLCVSWEERICVWRKLWMPRLLIWEEVREGKKREKNLSLNQT
jgi:hypothetical protein